MTFVRRARSTARPIADRRRRRRAPGRRRGRCRACVVSESRRPPASASLPSTYDTHGFARSKTTATPVCRATEPAASVAGAGGKAGRGVAAAAAFRRPSRTSSRRRCSAARCRLRPPPPAPSTASRPRRRVRLAPRKYRAISGSCRPAIAGDGAPRGVGLPRPRLRIPVRAFPPRPGPSERADSRFRHRPGSISITESWRRKTSVPGSSGRPDRAAGVGHRRPAAGDREIGPRPGRVLVVAQRRHVGQIEARGRARRVGELGQERARERPVEAGPERHDGVLVKRPPGLSVVRCRCRRRARPGCRPGSAARRTRCRCRPAVRLRISLAASSFRSMPSRLTSLMDCKITGSTACWRPERSMNFWRSASASAGS